MSRERLRASVVRKHWMRDNPIFGTVLAGGLCVIMSFCLLNRAEVCQAQSHLTDAERTKIQLEEKYRLEVRSQLKSDSLWDKFNSPIIVALFTSLIAAILLNTIRKRQEKREKERERTDTIERLCFQGELRLLEFEEALNRYSSSENFHWAGVIGHLEREPRLELIIGELEMLRFRRIRSSEGDPLTLLRNLDRAEPGNQDDFKLRRAKIRQFEPAVEKLHAALNEYKV
jgi:hypothetical protein